MADRLGRKVKLKKPWTKSGGVFAISDSPASDYLPDLKNLIWILGLFVVWFGFVSTSTYYHQFGVSYSSLGIPLQHQLYRGLTIISANNVFSLAFVAVFVVLAAARVGLIIRLRRTEIRATWYAPMFLGLIFLVGWYSSFVLARNAAYDDMYSSTTSLSALQSFETPNEIKRNYVNAVMAGRTVLLLYANESALFLFQEPSFPTRSVSVPVITLLLEKGDIYARQKVI
jgi:hypothetical protein